MARQPSRSWSVVLGLALVGLMAAGAGLFVAFAWHLFRGLQKEVAAALVTGMAAVLVSLLSVLGGRYLTRRQEVDQRHRESKIPMYEGFIDLLLGLMGVGTNGTSPDSEEATTALRKFTQELMVWGSEDVINEWSRFRRSGDAEPAQKVLALEPLLLAIRREFGHKNKKLEPNALLGLFINDIDQTRPPGAGRPA